MLCCRTCVKLTIVTIYVTIVNMNTDMAYSPGSPVSARTLADWALSRGYGSLTTREAADLLKVPIEQVRVRLHAPLKRGEWVSPARGLWVPVPPQYRAWGAPPALEFIDAMMAHLGATYYVGWLSAAAIFGASHHAAQVTQIAASKTVVARQVGRSRLEFFHRSNVAMIPTTPWRTSSGDVPVSTPEATCLDMAADPRIAGGIDNVANVIVGLADEDLINPDKIADLVPLFPVAACRRVGWILQTQTQLPNLEKLHTLLRTDEPSVLSPGQPRLGRIDRIWNVQLNIDLEVDA